MKVNRSRARGWLLILIGSGALGFAAVGYGLEQRFIVMGGDRDLGAFADNVILKVPINPFITITGTHTVDFENSGSCCSQLSTPANRTGIGILRTTFLLDARLKPIGPRKERLAITVRTEGRPPVTKFIELSYTIKRASP